MNVYVLVVRISLRADLSNQHATWLEYRLTSKLKQQLCIIKTLARCALFLYDSKITDAGSLKVHF